MRPDVLRPLPSRYQPDLLPHQAHGPTERPSRPVRQCERSDETQFALPTSVGCLDLQSPGVRLQTSFRISSLFCFLFLYFNPLYAGSFSAPVSIICARNAT